MSEVDETLPVGEEQMRPWARPDCPHCRGFGYYRVVASDTYQPGDTINCGNCYSAAHPDPELSTDPMKELCEAVGEYLLIDDPDGCNRISHGKCWTIACIQEGNAGTGGHDTSKASCPRWRLEVALENAKGGGR